RNDVQIGYFLCASLDAPPFGADGGFCPNSTSQELGSAKPRVTFERDKTANARAKKLSEAADAYDYIGIGAGSAGCAVAGRLAEANASVLLLEAGGPASNSWIHIPLGYAKLYANPSLNWCYTSEPEPHLNDRKFFQPRGKVLGGTGAINGMIYMRGQPQDFDH